MIKRWDQFQPAGRRRDFSVISPGDFMRMVQASEIDADPASATTVPGRAVSPVTPPTDPSP